MLTQFGHTLKQLGIEHIAAYSPQARDRSERTFETLQDRQNERFAVAAEQEGSAFVADTMEAWREILCIQEDRTVGNDNTVKWEGRRL